MTSPLVEPKSGRPVVHASVAGRVTQPDGYEIEKPYRSEVYISVNAGGDTDEPLADGLGVGELGADGLAMGRPPTPGSVEGLSTLRPTTPTAITTTAAIA